jgi:hypothetical protein
MSLENPSRSSFRAAVGKARSPLVKAKQVPGARTAGGLDGISVRRAVTRNVDHRGPDRHRLSQQQALVRFAGQTHGVELINLSGGGAMIDGDFTARPWDRLDLVLGEGGEIECAVRWIRGKRLGLEFAHETRVDCDPETLEAMLRKVIHNSFPGEEIALGATPQPGAVDEPQPDQRRIASRHPLIWNGIIHHDYEWDVARLRNISATGALIESPSEFPEGVNVFLELGGAGRIAATVSWSRGAQTGLAFSDEFDLTRLADSKPEVAPAKWNAPDYLQEQEEEERSPWAERWGRCSLEDLSRRLAR